MAVKIKKKISDDDTAEFKWPYGRNNYIIFGIAIVVIMIGYFTLARGSMTLAPVLLVLGYCVLIPLALLCKNRVDVKQEPSEAGEN